MEPANQTVPWEDIRLLEGERVWHLPSTTYRSWELVLGDDKGTPDVYLLAQAKEVCGEATRYCESAAAHLRDYVTRFDPEGWSVDALRFETPNSFVAELSHSDDPYGLWTVFMDGSRCNGGAMNYRPTRFTRTQD
jgi:hypothetical protein